MDGCLYLAPPQYGDRLMRELAGWGPARELCAGVHLLPGPARPAAWAADIWFAPREVAFSSIGEAVRILRGLAPRWGLVPGACYRRSVLIREQLRPRRDGPVAFPPERPLPPRGGFLLVDRGRLVASPTCARPRPGGELPQVEDRSGPPGRAYRKLREALLLLNEWPGPGERVLDLGAAPGAWTWVLAGLGAEVTAVDRSELDPQVTALPGVTAHRGSAFADELVTDGYDWLCCDVACYPRRLLGLIERWWDRCPRMVITLKFQGETDFAIIDAFRELPGSALIHLHANKHELTWLRHPVLGHGPWPRPWGGAGGAG